MERRSCGFTLVEVVVSITILSGLMLVASLGLSIVLDNWQRDRMGSRRDFADYSSAVLLKNAVEGTYDYYVRTSQRSTVRVPFFQTQSDGFSFVTTNGFFGRSGMALGRVRFQKRGDVYTLLYEESSLEDKYLDAFDQPVAYEKAVPVFAKIRSYVVRYYGARDDASAGLFNLGSELAALMQDSDVYDWFPDYNSSERRTLPKKISIQLAYQNGERKTLIFFIRAFDPAKQGIFYKDMLSETGK